MKGPLADVKLLRPRFLLNGRAAGDELLLLRVVLERHVGLQQPIEQLPLLLLRSRAARAKPQCETDQKDYAHRKKLEIRGALVKEIRC